MSNMVADDDLLGEDDSDGADFDITDEKEEELLQEDDYSKSRDVYDYNRKDSMSDIDEQDILNLDAEEDFQDVDEKPLYEEEEGKNKDISPSQKPDTPVPEETESTKQISSTPKNIKNNNAPPQKFQKTNFTKKKIQPWNDKIRRGGGRGGFQSRTNFSKNNQQRRRNGTVLINPRFEGTVHVNDNNARLAWDNSHYLPHNSNSVKPWDNGSFDVNPQEQLIKSILITSAPLLGPPVQQSLQNFYEPPPVERPIFFEPPPNIHDQNLNSTYGGQGQVPTHDIYPPIQPNSYTSGNTRNTRPSYNQLSNNRPPQAATYGYNGYNQYNRPTQQQYSFDSKTSYSNKNSNFNRSTGRSPPNYTLQSDGQQKSIPCTPDDEYQNRYSNYGNDSRNNYSFNYKGKNYERNNDRQGSLNSGNNYNNFKFDGRNYEKKQENTSYNHTEYQNQNTSNSGHNDIPYQRQFKSSSNVLLSPNKTNIYVTNQNIKDNNRTRRFPLNENFKNHLPEKKVKTNENSYNDDLEKYETPQNNDKSGTTVVPQAEEEEDEETRLYRLKIEEQKKERERLLRIKEERRKQMMMQKRKQDEELLTIGEFETEESSTISGQTNYQRTNDFQPITKSGFDQKSNQNLASSGLTQNQYRSNFSSSLSYQKSNEYFNSSGSFQQSKFQSIPTEPLLRPPSSSQKHVQFPSVSSSGSTNDVTNVTFKVDNQDNVLSKKVVTEASSSSFMSNRVVVVKSKNNQKVEVNSNQTFNTGAKNESSNVSSFLNNRKVLKKDNTLPNTRLVVVHNLSTTINRNKLVALTRGIGEIQSLEVDKQERQATILFKSVASAHVFFKKYQRRILDDLSVIEVKLEPMTST